MRTQDQRQIRTQHEVLALVCLVVIFIWRHTTIESATKLVSVPPQATGRHDVRGYMSSNVLGEQVVAEVLPFKGALSPYDIPKPSAEARKRFLERKTGRAAGGQTPSFDETVDPFTSFATDREQVANQKTKEETAPRGGKVLVPDSLRDVMGYGVLTLDGVNQALLTERNGCTLIRAGTGSALPEPLSDFSVVVTEGREVWLSRLGRDGDESECFTFDRGHPSRIEMSDVPESVRREFEQMASKAQSTLACASPSDVEW